VRRFETGATRDTDEGKLDYEGFFSPRVLRRRAEYMQEHAVQADGESRTSDNWQKGIPTEAYMKSLIRHVFHAWEIWRYAQLERFGEMHSSKELEDALCAVCFNAEGLLYELGRYKVIDSVPEVYPNHVPERS
jgi:hypothetical protein